MRRRLPLWFAAFLAVTGAARAAPADAANDLRDIRVGMPVADLPAHGYTDYACAAAPSEKLDDWSGWRRCPAEPGGLHAVSFRFDEAADPRAAINDRYAGTKVGGHPVRLALLIGNDAKVDGLRIETDPTARPYLHKKAFLLGEQVKLRYGTDGWRCTDAKPLADEEPVGGTFVKQHCEKTAEGRHYVVDRELFRHEGDDLRKAVSATQVTILRDGNPG